MRVNTTRNFRRFFGSFGTATIAQGETLQLSFDYRFQEVASGAGLFRFGLYNNGGTALSADSTVADLNDFGYAVTTNPGENLATCTQVNSETAGTPSWAVRHPSAWLR